MSTDASASSVKARAEARRRRILEQSQVRIGVVSGESIPSVPPTSTVVHESSPVQPVTSPMSHTEEDLSTAMESSTNTTTSNNSGVNRLAQMRKRRFATKKEEASSPSDMNSHEEIVTKTTNYEAMSEWNQSTSLGVSDSDGPKEKTAARDERPTSVDHVICEQREIGTEIEKKSEPTCVRSSDTTDDTVIELKEEVSSMVRENIPSHPPNSEPKKYLGVAKIRRKLLAEQKTVSSTGNPDDALKIQTIANKPMKLKPKRQWNQLAPLVAHIFTIILLFSAGLDVGLYNNPSLSKSHFPRNSIKEKLSFIENGIGVVTWFKRSNETQHYDITEKLSKNIHATVNPVRRFEYDDEFETESGKDSEAIKMAQNFKKTILPFGATEKKQIPSNIDPIFRVDLDELTNKPGVIFAAARVAVAIHRFLGFILWTYPYSIIRFVVTTPLQILSPPPPVFFLYAVVIRLIGKYILGTGNVPNLVDLWDKALRAGDSPSRLDSSTAGGSGIILDGDNGSKSSSGNVPDIVGLGKNFVFNIITTKFPKITMAFGIFRDSRSDMYVVLSGFFVGLIFPSQFYGFVSSSVQMPSAEEL